MASEVAADSDDETIEYSIEIVDSSSSIPSSIAGNLSHSSSSASLQEQLQQQQQQIQEVIETNEQQQHDRQGDSSNVKQDGLNGDEFEMVACRMTKEPIVEMEKEAKSVDGLAEIEKAKPNQEAPVELQQQPEVGGNDSEVANAQNAPVPPLDESEPESSYASTTEPAKFSGPQNNSTEILIEVQASSGEPIGTFAIDIEDSRGEVLQADVTEVGEPEVLVGSQEILLANPSPSNESEQALEPTQIPQNPREVSDLSQSCGIDRVTETGSDPVDHHDDLDLSVQKEKLEQQTGPKTSCCDTQVEDSNNNNREPPPPVEPSQQTEQASEPPQLPIASEPEGPDEHCDSGLEIELPEGVECESPVAAAAAAVAVQQEVELEQPLEAAEVFEDTFETQQVIEPTIKSEDVAVVDLCENTPKQELEAGEATTNVITQIQSNVDEPLETEIRNPEAVLRDEDDDGSNDDVTLIEDATTSNDEMNDQPPEAHNFGLEQLLGEHQADRLQDDGGLNNLQDLNILQLGVSINHLMAIHDKVPHISVPLSHGSSSWPDLEDLEHEFDIEPALERRQVMIKLDTDPRQVYSMEDELGRGKFGIIYRCIEQASGHKFAAKFVHVRRREDRDDVGREIGIMNVLQHKRLLQLFDAFDDGRSEMCLITELVEGGELFERIVNDDFELTEKKAAIFMRQICEGVEYMHSLNIVHLDMKPENILCVSRTGNRIKLIDFGLARRLNEEEPLRVMFGTPDFAAPEVLAYDTVSLATDMWSVGVICYVLLSGLSPFMGDNDIETMANVTRATYDFDDESFDPISDLAKDFISKLLVKDQSQRLKPNECLEHAWLQRGGAQLDASVNERRNSMAMLDLISLAQFANYNASPSQPATQQTSVVLPIAPLLFDQTCSPPSLDKRNLKKYVVRRKWHKAVHTIMALQRMGANLKF